MHVVTDDERREAAERLRDVARAARWSLGDIGFTEAMHRALGGGDWRDMTERLADLIDPGESGQNRDTNRDTVPKESPAVQKAPECDREALLALADEMEQAGKDYRYQMVENACCDNLINDAPDDFIGYARRIRKACGEVAE